MYKKTDLQEIQRFIEALASLGVRPSVDMRHLYRFYELRDFVGMLSEIKQRLGVPCRLVLGTVNAGGPKDAGAWVERPKEMPLYGTLSLKNTTAIIYARKELLQNTRFEHITHAFAHECCHLILDSTCHDLQKEERAVDLLVMMRGFSEITLSLHGGTVRGRLWKILGGFKTHAKQEQEVSIGYLTTTEIEYAHDLILQMREQKKK